MGFAFAAGTTDGPGAFDFKQGDDQVIFKCKTFQVIHFPKLPYYYFPDCFMLIILSMILYQGNPFWKLVRNLLKTPGKEQVDCQHPKPILLDTGEMTEPYDWAVCNRIFCIFVENDVKLKES